jgi:biotin synthase-like enzyme
MDYFDCILETANGLCRKIVAEEARKNRIKIKENLKHARYDIKEVSKEFYKNITPCEKWDRKFIETWSSYKDVDVETILEKYSTNETVLDRLNKISIGDTTGSSHGSAVYPSTYEIKRVR